VYIEWFSLCGSLSQAQLAESWMCITSWPYPIVHTLHLMLRYFILDTLYSILDTWYLILDTWYFILYTWYLILDTWYLILDTWYLILDTWYFILYSILCTLYFTLCNIYMICVFGGRPMSRFRSVDSSNPEYGQTLTTSIMTMVSPRTTHGYPCYRGFPHLNFSDELLHIGGVAVPQAPSFFH
jgi:hypothetical protein